MLFDDVQLLFFDDVGHVECRAAAVRTLVGLEGVFLDGQVLRQRLAACRLWARLLLFVFDGSSGGFGRASKVVFASPSTAEGCSSGFVGVGLRCLRCATASSSATRSFSFAMVSRSCAS